jgi:hypothetical protein
MLNNILCYQLTQHSFYIDSKMRALMRFCMRAARISLHLGVAYTVLYTTATSYLLSQIPDDQVSHLPVPVQRLIEFSMPVPAPFGGR